MLHRHGFGSGFQAIACCITDHCPLADGPQTEASDKTAYAQKKVLSYPI